MTLLRETLIHCSIIERYERHRFLERLMTPRIDSHYTWKSLSTSFVKVRCDLEEDQQFGQTWQAVAVPENGALLRFDLDAHLRTGYGKDRRSNTDYISNLEWIEAKADEIGFKLRSVDYEPLRVPVNYPDDPIRKLGPFVKMGSRFRGLAFMLDTTKFMKAISFGIGDAKAFGFGLLDYTVV